MFVMDSLETRLRWFADAGVADKLDGVSGAEGCSGKGMAEGVTEEEEEVGVDAVSGDATVLGGVVHVSAALELTLPRPAAATAAVTAAASAVTVTLIVVGVVVAEDDSGTFVPVAAASAAVAAKVAGAAEGGA